MLNFKKKTLVCILAIVALYSTFENVQERSSTFEKVRVTRSKEVLYSLENNFNKTNQRLVDDELIDKNLFDFDVILDYDNIKSLNKLFKKTIQIFNKNNISYWSFGGTLIGAIKNKGNLAWDDDHDLCLMYEDFSKFISLDQHFKKENIGLTKNSFFYKLHDLKGKKWDLLLSFC